MATIDTRENDEDFSAEVNLKIWHWDASTWVLNTRIDRPHGTKRTVAIDFLPGAEGKDNELLMTVGLDGNAKTWCIRSLAVKNDVEEGKQTSLGFIRNVLNSCSRLLDKSI